MADRVPRKQPWPAYEGRCKAIARDKVRDLGRDEPLREELTRLCVVWASRSWGG